MGIMLKIKLASPKEIIDSREQWNNMVSSMRLPSVFLTWEWITCWLKYYEKFYLPLILFVYDRDEELKAIIPLAKRRRRIPGGLSNIRVVSFCGSFELYPDYLDVICVEKEGYTCAGSIIDYFAHEYKDWDVLHFSDITDNGCLDRWLQSHYQNHWIDYTVETIAPCIKINSDFDLGLKRLKRKKIYNLKREAKLLFNKNVTFRQIEDIKDIENALDALFLLHKARAADKQIHSTFAGNTIYRFHLDLSKSFLENGWLRLYVLEYNNVAISAVYGFLFEKRFYYYQTGLSPDWKKYGAGKILIYKILEDIYQTDAVEFDFLGGADKYKTYWTKDFRVLKTVNIYNKNVMGRVEKVAGKLIRSMKKFRSSRVN